jgi:ParB family chromosome partitioning protein
MVSRGTLTAGHGRALLTIESEEGQLGLADKVSARSLSVREAERLAARHSGRSRTTRLRQPSPNVVQLEESLSEALGVRVEIKQKRKGGKVVVHFDNHDEFECVYQAITGRATADLDYVARIPA